MKLSHIRTRGRSFPGQDESQRSPRQPVLLAGLGAGDTTSTHRSSISCHVVIQTQSAHVRVPADTGPLTPYTSSTSPVSPPQHQTTLGFCPVWGQATPRPGRTQPRRQMPPPATSPGVGTRCSTAWDILVCVTATKRRRARSHAPQDDTRHRSANRAWQSGVGELRTAAVKGNDLQSIRAMQMKPLGFLIPDKTFPGTGCPPEVPPKSAPVQLIPPRRTEATGEGLSIPQSSQANRGGYEVLHKRHSLQIR